MTQRVAGTKGEPGGGSARLGMAISVVLLGACGGSASSTNVAPDGSGSPRPTLSFSASPITVAGGGSSILTWDGGNVSSCEASNGWSGSRGTSGTEDVGPLDGDTTFRLSCSGAGGGVSREVTVTVDQGNGPTVTLSAEPEHVIAGQSAVLTWTSHAVTGCTAGGGWSGAQDPSGTFDTGPLSVTTNFSLTCSGASGNALASVSVQVVDKILRWQAPTQNVDGTAIDDLAGFHIYWGTQSRDYGQNRHTIRDPGATAWEVTVAPGTYFFSLTAFDAEGNESGYSNEVTKVIP